MLLTDLMPLAEWAALEREIFERSGLWPAIYDPHGFRITESMAPVNRLCPAVRQSPQALNSVCSLAQSYMGAEVRRTGLPLIDACDGGLVKVCVPVIHDGEYLGAVGGCGLIEEDEDADAFLLSKATGKDEADIEELAADCGRITRAKAEALALYLKERVARCLANAS